MLNEQLFDENDEQTDGQRRRRQFITAKVEGLEALVKDEALLDALAKSCAGYGKHGSSPARPQG